jgi:hypothetical protein
MNASNIGHYRYKEKKKKKERKYNAALSMSGEEMTNTDASRRHVLGIVQERDRSLRVLQSRTA